MMASDNNEKEHNLSPRFNAWVALTVFSAICLGSHVSSIILSSSSDDKWVTAVTSISMTFAFLVVVLHLVAADKFIGQKPEGAVSFLLLLFWSAGLPVIMDPNNGIAQFISPGLQAIGFVGNWNLYLFSWGAFASTLFICGNYVQNLLGPREYSSTPAKVTEWCVLIITSLVVFSSSITIHQDLDCTSDDFFSNYNINEACNRNNYAIFLGAIGTITTLIFVILAALDKGILVLETGLAIIIFTLYCFGLGYITYGLGPGTYAGNIYFSTVVGFTVALFLTSTCIAEVVSVWKEGSPAWRAFRPRTPAAAPPAPTPEPEIIVTNDELVEVSPVEPVEI